MNNPIIKEIKAREILDSRGFPTVEVELTLSPHFTGRAAVPSGASTGKFEALELRDGNKDYFLGKGVKQAVENVNKIIAPKLINQSGLSQKDLDQILLSLDGTENKTKLGANAILGVSMAYAKACSLFHDLPLFMWLRKEFAKEFAVKDSYELPVPLINIINGGAHANNNLDIQEFMVVPAGFDSFHRAMQAGCEIFHSLKKIFSEKGYITTVGDEGGLAPNLSSNKEALEYIVQATQKAGYSPGKDVFFALDVVSSEFYKDGAYFFASVNEKRDSQEMASFYEDLTKKFPIVSIEDALDQEDWDGWKMLTEKIGSTCQLVGDDLFVTNPKKLKQAIEGKVANAILIKLNQIGSLSETLETIAMAQKAGFGCVISHRSGETEDTFIADLAVAVNAKQIKTGSTSRSERIAKYNQLLRIEEMLGSDASFPGKKTYSL